MSVRKRRWTSNGAEREAWVVDYTDSHGKRRLKTFARKKEADEFEKRAGVEVLDGIHVADADTVTIGEAGKLWLQSGDAAGLERTSLDQRRQHLELHIKPFIGDVKLNKVTVPSVRSFQDQLRAASRSPAMIKRVTVSLGSILADAQGRGLTIRNPVHERTRARSANGSSERRDKARLQVGVDIPSPSEVKAFLAHAKGRWRPFFLTAVFTGMRASELRGLSWRDVDLDAKVVTVRQRADAYRKIGRPKSEAGGRSIPVPPIVVNALKEWKLACPKGELGLVFPNGAGQVEAHANIVNRGLAPTMIAAGVCVATGKPDREGRPVPAAKYTGLHSLRHFYASWCINPVSAGGQGLTPKVVQERLGHASITMTLDVYGHLFPRGDDDAQLAAAAAALVT